MDQEKLERLADIFLQEVLSVQRGSEVYIEYQGPDAKPLADVCAGRARMMGAFTHVADVGSRVISEMVTGASDDDLIMIGRQDLDTMQGITHCLSIRDTADQARTRISPKDMLRHQTLVRRASSTYRVENTRWLVVAAPTQALADSFGMETSEFEEFFTRIYAYNYDRMKKAAEFLKDLLQNGKTVRIVGQNADLSFSIEGIDAFACTGEVNRPDGEVLTAPVKHSVNGTIQFGPSTYMGQKFSSIWLRFENGKVVDATAEDEEHTTALNNILNIDEGARYIGEFAIAFNPFILKPVGDILFDEKIMGSLHLALGKCYVKWANNGNTSSIHWDMVHIQRPEYGGGEIWVDDRLIRKDGRFVVPELLALNPENLAPSP